MTEIKPTQCGFMKPNQRGFMRGEFLDYYGKECSIQESSLATGSCIWLGCDEGTHVDGKCLARMHLTQEMAYDLIPFLEDFVETGSLHNVKSKSKQSKQMYFFIGLLVGIIISLILECISFLVS